MPRSIDEVFMNGILVSSVIKPWTQQELISEIADFRWIKETSGITVGNQVVTTERHEMPIWLAMLLDISMRPGERTSFVYKPQGGSLVELSIPQVLRCYECFAWYISACFATEKYFQALITQESAQENPNFDGIAAAALNDLSWPQRIFPWEV